MARFWTLLTSDIQTLQTCMDAERPPMPLPALLEIFPQEQN